MTINQLIHSVEIDLKNTAFFVKPNKGTIAFFNKERGIKNTVVDNIKEQVKAFIEDYKNEIASQGSADEIKISYANLRALLDTMDYTIVSINMTDNIIHLDEATQ